MFNLEAFLIFFIADLHVDGSIFSVPNFPRTTVTEYRIIDALLLEDEEIYHHLHKRAQQKILVKAYFLLCSFDSM